MKQIWFTLIEEFDAGDDEKCENIWHKMTSQEQREFVQLLQNKFYERKYDSLYKFYMDLYNQTKIVFNESLIMN